MVPPVDDKVRPVGSLESAEFQRPAECSHGSCASLRSVRLELERLRRVEADLSRSLARERLLV